jgi:hypothetical protein
VAPQTDPIKYGIGRLAYDIIVNITVHSEIKFYPVKVKLAFTTSCTCIMALYVREITNLYSRNQVHHIVALIAENALKLTYRLICTSKSFVGQKNYYYPLFISQPSPGGQKILCGQKPGSIKCSI